MPQEINQKLPDIPTMIESLAGDLPIQDLRKWCEIWADKINNENFAREYKGLLELGQNRGQTLQLKTSISHEESTGVYDILTSENHTVGHYIPAAAESRV